MATPEWNARVNGVSSTKANTPRKIRALLADEHAIVREGVKGILMAEPDLEVVGEAEDGVQAVEQAKQLKPDVAVLDISMPRMNGIEATKQIKAALPDIHTLALTMHA